MNFHNLPRAAWGGPAPCCSRLATVSAGSPGFTTLRNEGSGHVTALGAGIKPSPQARTLFNTMAVVAQPLESDGDVLHVSLLDTIRIGCRRAREGQITQSSAEVSELLDQQWISPAEDGGWLLT